MEGDGGSEGGSMKEKQMQKNIRNKSAQLTILRLKRHTQNPINYNRWSVLRK